ncbi:MAG: alpha/beta hydrolase [Rhodobacteraceae bacterium]|nr:alpha/beta hydrolase [Paracoccaceae bacterium]
MFVRVNGIRLFVDIEGAGLIPDGPTMREKSTLVVLHGGPGADHSIYKPAFSQLSDICQIVYLDQRGNGRSDNGNPADWTLAQWGDDVKALCDTLGIIKPIVFGASWGGVVAQAYATRHPDHPGALILSNTTTRTEFEEIFKAFGRIGGPTAEEVARTYWLSPTPERRQAYFETCLPLYSVTEPDPMMMPRMILKNPVGMHYNGPANEQGKFDFRAGLSQVSCPALVLAGDTDPIMPAAFSEALHDALPNSSYTCFENAGHMLQKDQPEAFFAALRSFINAQSDAPNL